MPVAMLFLQFRSIDASFAKTNQKKAKSTRLRTGVAASSTAASFKIEILSVINELSFLNVEIWAARVATHPEFFSCSACIILIDIPVKLYVGNNINCSSIYILTVVLDLHYLPRSQSIHSTLFNLLPI